MNKKRRLVLIDGHALIHRAYHAYPKSLTTTKGELVNAVYGFTSNLFSIFKQLKPEYVVATFDLKGPTFRHQEFKGYKASRPKTEEELINQVDRVKQVVKVLNIPIFEVAGFEADDVIGTLARQGREKLEEIVIATGDRDALQLVNGEVKVFFPSRGKAPARLVGKKEFKEEYGFSPKQLVDFKALAGDASDDIPGVRGIGSKKATILIKQFGTVEKLYRELDKYQDIGRDPGKTGLTRKDLEKLKDSKNQAFLSKRLAAIVTDVPIKLVVAACKLTDYDKEKAKKLFMELEFQTLISRLPGEEVRKKAKNKVKLVRENKEQQMGFF